MSLGIQAAFNKMDVIVQRNTPIPIIVDKIYETAYENQKKITIDVRQGESNKAKSNHFLGKFQVRDIPPGPKG